MDVDSDSNATYYSNRAEMERVMADQAPTEAIREIHLQLAERYAKLANEFDERSNLPGSNSTQPIG
jgi:hypothetical protein